MWHIYAPTSPIYAHQIFCIGGIYDQFGTSVSVTYLAITYKIDVEVGCVQQS